MIVRSRGRNVEVRDGFGAWSQYIPSPSMYGPSTTTGRRVDAAEAVGLPAVLAAVRLLSQTVGKLPLKVYRDREEARDSLQWAVLHEKPNQWQTPYQLWAALTTSLDCHGNAFLLKTKARGRITELYLLDPCRMKVKLESGSLVYEYREDKGKVTRLSRNDLIHVAGPLVMAEMPYIGVSAISAARNALGYALGLEEFGARFFENDATPGAVITHKGNLTKEQREDLRNSFEARHRGASNAHRAAILWGGAEIERLSFSPSDAAWIEARQLSIDDVARIFGIPAGMIGSHGQGMSGAGKAEAPLSENRRFLDDALQPRFTCIEQSLWADDDLFPDKSLKPEFVADAILRADLTERFKAYLPAKQAGWITANEIRALENYPPHPDGDQLQETPVGGAPNDNSQEPKP